MLFKPFKPSIKEIAPFIKEAISNGSDARLTVTGYSMYPLLRSGVDDIILTKVIELKKYDVVLFERANGDCIFHRIIKIKDDVLTIAGDNETKKEFPVYKDAVIAKMKAFVRGDKTYSVNSLWYVLYSRLWLWLFPLRPIMAKAWHDAARLRRKIKGAFGHKKGK